MKIYFNPDYCASDYAFDTTRKSIHIAQTLSDEWWAELDDPETHYDAADKLIAEFHDPSYVEAIKTGTPTSLARSQGFDWDPNIYKMARAHVAGCLAAADNAIDRNSVAGTLSSGLHHARRDSGVGFCTFNGVALTARHCEQKGLTSLIIDLDAHCGGGTYSMINHDTTYQWDFSTNSFDSYEVEDELDRLWITNVDRYISNLIKMLDHDILDEIDPDIIIYNAGVDPLNDGVLDVQLLTRERLMSAFLAEVGKPVVVTMAGGYTWDDHTMDDIVAAHVSTLSEMNVGSLQQLMMRIDSAV